MLDHPVFLRMPTEDEKLYFAHKSSAENLMGVLVAAQRLFLWRQIRDRAGYARRPPHERQRMDELIEKLRQGEKLTHEEEGLLCR